MAQFVNPFAGKTPERKLTDSELVRALRQNIAAEHEAVHLYMAHADATDNPLAKAVLIDIANEEIVHAGEFQRLLNILTNGEEQKWLDEGSQEVDEIAGSLAGGASPGEAGASATDRSFTVGPMRD